MGREELRAISTFSALVCEWMVVPVAHSGPLGRGSGRKMSLV